MIKILLADEQASIRRGLRMRLTLEPDFTIVGETGDGWEALQLVRELQPDVIVTSIRLVELDGFALTARLHHDWPSCAVVMLSLYDNLENRERAAQVGAFTFVGKQGQDSELVNAIRAAAISTSR